jgi:TolB-like protein
MERRLAAILMADVVGYSSLIETDEAGTLAALKERRTTVLDPTVRAHGGRVVKVMGDGVLVEFASAVNAVVGAMDLQRKMAEANARLPDVRGIVLRIGINLGDVIGEGGDIYGEGVNIAARLESLAEPGGICISAKVYEEVRGKTSFAFDDAGEQTVKNIARPIRTYRLRHDSVSGNASLARPSLSLPDKPSIAVLPFQNMSEDAEQEYFADGMVEEIITALSRIRWLFVIARNSTFIYKGRPVDVKQIGRELGVRYVLEGSVRKAGNKVRITGQLIDSTLGSHLWADRFDGSLENVFDLQDQVTASVIAAIAPKLEQAEIERSRRKPTESLDAYDYYLRGLAAAHQWTKPASIEALAHFYRAVELDPGFASAYGMAARCYSMRKVGGWRRPISSSGAMMKHWRGLSVRCASGRTSCSQQRWWRQALRFLAILREPTKRLSNSAAVILTCPFQCSAFTFRRAALRTLSDMPRDCAGRGCLNDDLSLLDYGRFAFRARPSSQGCIRVRWQTPMR